MYPFKFNPILKSTIWGGEKIIPFKHLNIEQPQVGESWEISNVPGDESVVANGTEAGKNLSQLVKEYKGSLVGDSNYQRFGDNFPLLIKFIDACDDLSKCIQMMNWQRSVIIRWARPKCGMLLTMPGGKHICVRD